MPQTSGLETPIGAAAGDDAEAPAGKASKGK